MCDAFHAPCQALPRILRDTSSLPLPCPAALAREADAEELWGLGLAGAVIPASPTDASRR
ncbi:hypothetical protein SAMN05880582_10821 [Rhizobium sp. RU20A]|nr:hypothetical protein SAMN05880582_10821 [Rhizobium sp. RU20A]